MNMKQIMRTLRLNVEEAASLMYVPRTTLSTWLKKKSIMPETQRRYRKAFKTYLENINDDILRQELAVFESPVYVKEDENLRERLEKLELQLEKQQHRFEVLEHKRKQEFSRFHLFKEYPAFIDDDIETKELVVMQAALLQKKSKYQLQYKLAVVQRKLLIEIAGTEAKINTIKSFLEKGNG